MLSENSKESLKLPSGLTVSKEHFSLERPGKVELKSEILFLNDMIYIWIGSSLMHRMDNLQVAYPGQNMIDAVAKIVFGGDDLNSSNQLMAKRLSHKFGIPVFLSFNYEIPEYEDAAERNEIFRWISNILIDKIK